MAQRRRSPSAVGCALLLTALAHAAVGRADPFVPGCAVPFASIAQPHAIDGATGCGNEGGAFGPRDPGTPAHRAQNRAKNNLCATGAPSRVTIFTMKKLQQITNQMKAAHQLKFGAPDVLPEDRRALQNLRTTSDGNTIGEGSLVQFVGLIQKTKPGGSETVNCGRSGVDNNDIHIVLAGTKQAAECSSIIAEMVPHLRPTAWNGTQHDSQAGAPSGATLLRRESYPCSRGAPVELGDPPGVWDRRLHPRCPQPLHVRR